MIVSDLALLEALPGKLAALCTLRAEVGVLEDTAPRTRKRPRAEMQAERERIVRPGNAPYPQDLVKIAAVKTTVVGDETNASVGVVHEFGSTSGKIPKRSFLRDPITMRGEEETAAHALDALLEDYVVGQATREDMVERLATSAEAAIDGAFDSGGYGTWPQLADSTAAAKGSDRILIESEQLRKSITHRVTSAPA